MWFIFSRATIEKMHINKPNHIHGVLFIDGSTGDRRVALCLRLIGALEPFMLDLRGKA